MPFDETTPPRDESLQSSSETIGPSQFHGEDKPSPERNMRTDLLASPAQPTAPEPLSPLVETESGQKIPVRYEKGNTYPRYTDSNGNSLFTGENISPGSPLVGEKYEHNPEKAHAMAEAGNETRVIASQLRKGAEDLVWPEYKGEELEAAQAEDKEAEHLEEQAGMQYDSEQMRVKDYDKAQTMALAGDQQRSSAARLRKAAEVAGRGSDEVDQAVAAQFHSDAQKADAIAEVAEVEAGNQHEKLALLTLKEKAKDALDEMNKIMDNSRENPNPLLMKSLDQGRRYLESLIDLEQ